MYSNASTSPAKPFLDLWNSSNVADEASSRLVRGSSTATRVLSPASSIGSDQSSEAAVGWSRAWKFEDPLKSPPVTPRHRGPWKSNDANYALQPESAAGRNTPRKVWRSLRTAKGRSLKSPEPPSSPASTSGSTAASLSSPRSSQQPSRHSLHSGILPGPNSQSFVAPPRRRSWDSIGTATEKERSVGDSFGWRGSFRKSFGAETEKSVGDAVSQLRRRSFEDSFGEVKVYTMPELPAISRIGKDITLPAAGQTADVQQAPMNASHRFTDAESVAAPSRSIRAVCHSCAADAKEFGELDIREFGDSELATKGKPDGPSEPDKSSIGTDVIKTSRENESQSVNQQPRASAETLDTQRVFDRLHTFVTEKIDTPQPFYGVSLKVLETLGSIKKHEWLLENKMLMDCTFEHSYVIFVLHEWLGHNDPDPRQTHLMKILEFARQRQNELKKNEFDDVDVSLWIDYCCVPQDNVEERKIYLKALPAIIRACDCLVVIAPWTVRQSGTKATLETFIERGWCTFELLARVCLHSGEDPEIYVIEGNLVPISIMSLDSPLKKKQIVEFLPLQLKFSCCQRAAAGVTMEETVTSCAVKAKEKSKKEVEERHPGLTRTLQITVSDLDGWRQAVEYRPQKTVVQCDREVLGPMLVYVYAAAIHRAVRLHGEWESGELALKIAKVIDKLLPKDVCDASLHELQTALGIKLSQSIVEAVIDCAARGEVKGTRLNIPDYYLPVPEVDEKEEAAKRARQLAEQQSKKENERAKPENRWYRAYQRTRCVLSWRKT